MADAKRISICELVEWAFSVEHAELILPSDHDPAVRGAGLSMEYILIERAKLGASIDTSRGRSEPHFDAEIVAGSLSKMAREHGVQQVLTVWQSAKSGLAPDWMEGAVPRLEPIEWKAANQTGRQGRTAVVDVMFEPISVPHPKNPAKRITRQKKIEIRWTPCHWVPDPQEITSARAEYQSWASMMMLLRADLVLGGLLRAHVLTAELPPLAPWKARAV